jgi:hypothetical protein
VLATEEGVVTELVLDANPVVRSVAAPPTLRGAQSGGRRPGPGRELGRHRSRAHEVPERFW